MSEIKETAPALPAALNPPSTELTLVAERSLMRPTHLERLYTKHLNALYEPQRVEPMLEMSILTQEGGKLQLSWTLC